MGAQGWTSSLAVSVLVGMDARSVLLWESALSGHQFRQFCSWGATTNKGFSSMFNSKYFVCLKQGR